MTWTAINKNETYKTNNVIKKLDNIYKYLISKSCMRLTSGYMHQGNTVVYFFF